MKKILIIDDEEAILKMYKTALDGYDVSISKDSEEAFQLAQQTLPDLIYLDIIMPRLNGLDFLKKLKNTKETKEIPVIILTNLPKEASAEKAKSLGAIDYFVKAEHDPEKVAEITKEVLGE